MIPVFDGHNDVLLSLTQPERGQGRSFFVKSEHGHLDLPRAREGGFAGGFFAIFIPPPESTPSRKITVADGVEIDYPPSITRDHALPPALAMAGLLHQLAAESDEFEVVRDVTSLRRCLENDIVAAILHFEGAEPLDPELESLPFFYEAGLRSLGPVWSRSNAFAHGVPFRCPQSPDVGPGLTDAGVHLVRECNRLGILLDLAHLNERGFWDVAEHSSAPLVSTHTCAHAICPSARNVTDRQIDAIGETGGVIGVNFFVGDLRDDGKRDVNTPLTQILRHVDYIVDRIGIDHVAFGSDFDGATMSDEVQDASGLQKVIAVLRDAGYDDTALTKIATGNWLRVLGDTWR